MSTHTPPPPSVRYYNPDWLSDTDLVDGFIARQGLLEFFRGELRRAPAQGNVQHYLVVGVRGSGKTTLLKRLAVAMRQEPDLADHLIPLSFPEELYEVKGLSDFWWAACRALEDALDRTGQRQAADALGGQIDGHDPQAARKDPHDDTGLHLLLSTCRQLQRRPVLLVDNLDFLLKRIDKSGRKLNDPQSHAYWALREALSTQDAPLLIGGSVRLSEPLVGYDKAFFDFFVPHRLGKLSLDDVQLIFDHLAQRHGGPELQRRIRERPGRVRALYEMTGGNPRALGLIFELLRQGPSSRAVDDFERLLDLTTPYYKARFEDLPEQAQVVMHALALAKRDHSKHPFGHTAANIAKQAGLETRTVSAQLDVLINEGVVEKDNQGKGRTQYRIAEQLFRLWMQMRSTRRVRQQVVGLTEFLETLFDHDECERMVQAELNGQQAGTAMGRARMHLALSQLQTDLGSRRQLESHAADAILQANADGQSTLDEAFAPGDLPEEVATLAKCQADLQKCLPRLRTLQVDVDTTLTSFLGSLTLSQEDKCASTALLRDRSTASAELARLNPLLSAEHKSLLKQGLNAEDISLLHRERQSGRLSLAELSPTHRALRDSNGVRCLVWRLLGAGLIPLAAEDVANAWLAWAQQNTPESTALEWARFGRRLRRSGHHITAESAVDISLKKGECALAWSELGQLHKVNGAPQKAEAALKKAIVLDNKSIGPWFRLADLLANHLHRSHEAEAAILQAIKIDPTQAECYAILGLILADDPNRTSDAEQAFRQALEISPDIANRWVLLAGTLASQPNRKAEAVEAYRRAIELDPNHILAWIQMGLTLELLDQSKEAAAAFHHALDIHPTRAEEWLGLGLLHEFKLTHTGEAEAAYRQAIDVNPKYARAWRQLGKLLSENEQRHDEAIAALQTATKLDPGDAFAQSTLTQVLSKPALTAIIKAVEAGDTHAMKQGLLRLPNDGQKVHPWLISEPFVEGLIGKALAQGQGAELLATLRDLGFERIAAPLLMALDAAIDGGADKLASVEPEARAAALELYHRMVSAK
jgi:tetratricopeptide (TPR) repeat protein/DNA-binding transcriptional ArsR family regulator